MKKLINILLIIFILTMTSKIIYDVVSKERYMAKIDSFNITSEELIEVLNENNALLDKVIGEE